MIPFTKAHAYGNDFLYVLDADVSAPLDELSRRLCDRHAGIGADGLITYTRTAAGATMRLFNADGSRAEVSGNGVRGLAAILLRDDERASATVMIESEGGTKQLTRTERAGQRQTFRAAMGMPEQLREVPLDLLPPLFLGAIAQHEARMIGYALEELVVHGGNDAPPLVERARGAHAIGERALHFVVRSQARGAAQVLAAHGLTSRCRRRPLPRCTHR